MGGDGKLAAGAYGYDGAWRGWDGGAEGCCFGVDISILLTGRDLISDVETLLHK